MERQQREPTFYPTPTSCDFCKQPLGILPTQEANFVDGKTIHQGCWGIMCLDCHNIHGVGLGLGRGQKYKLTAETYLFPGKSGKFESTERVVHNAE